jgi:hypothetical protein
MFSRISFFFFFCWIGKLFFFYKGVSPQFDDVALFIFHKHRLADKSALGGVAWVYFTTHRIKKELSICQSLLRPDLVSFPVLSQIKPQAPLLVVPFRQFLYSFKMLKDFILLKPRLYLKIDIYYQFHHHLVCELHPFIIYNINKKKKKKRI